MQLSSAQTRSFKLVTSCQSLDRGMFPDVLNYLSDFFFNRYRDFDFYLFEEFSPNDTSQNFRRTLHKTVLELLVPTMQQ
jgi:hypothetical protein